MFLFHISTPSFGVTTTIFGIGILYYAMTTSISVFVTSSPFHSPLSRTLATVYRRVHAYFCPNDFHFIFPDMQLRSLECQKLGFSVSFRWYSMPAYPNFVMKIFACLLL